MMGRTALRWTGGLMALTLVVLWVFLVRYLFQQSGQEPAPAVLLLPLLFFSLAIWAGVAAVRDEPVLVLLAAGLSLVPTGLFLLFMPGFARWIGILNLGLLVIGVILLRWPGEAGWEASAPDRGDHRDSRDGKEASVRGDGGSRSP
jgi:hypothetical protein